MNKNKKWFIFRHPGRFFLWFAGILVLLWLLFYRTSQYIEEPGTAEPLNQYVQVNHKRDHAKGSYMLTTVGVQGPATPLMLAIAHFKPYDDVTSQQELMGNENNSQYNQLQDYYMKSSENNAIVVAYKAAHKAYTKKYLGVYVWTIMDQSNFKTVLKVGDTITKIDGHAFKSSQAFIDYVKGKKLGTKVTITYLRAGHTHQATRKLIQLPGTKRAGLGITLTDHTTVKTKIPVKVNAGSIGGPSAGMMFTLQIYSQLTNQAALRNGQNIAGTGTIAEDGSVGQIGGIDKKVVAANREGAKVFFAPDEPATKAIKKLDPTYVNNYVTAKKTVRKLHSQMKVVPVRNFKDVIKYLQTHQTK
ncbi:lipoprotein precursor [Lactobacillus selangorensis]|uniref:Lipoprotein n=1 Tax=Lactobacillus selangorensis TaxID=81857 RepID=A0A0R2G9Y1_9LACO|nr:SepM family pheromone-processing serine protease [Lactobacillus selangorensis]KRN29397.1 lipoprotein precursor [Lactobacillus selangorensis]KRN34074.1 lipoprotein precursor [Lactobacillus selangorensis]